MKKILISLVIFLAAACSEKIAPAGETNTKESEEFIRGQKIFMTTCNRCHPAGRGGLGPSIMNKPGFLIKFQVRNGLGVMPSFDKKRLSPEDLDNLVTYIKSIR